MLLAIDLGNTKAAFGFWNGIQWSTTLSVPVESITSSPELHSWLSSLRSQCEAITVSCASVNPKFEPEIETVVHEHLCSPVRFLRSAIDFGVETNYSEQIGADRLAVIAGAKSLFECPMILFDVGTATTVEAIDASGLHLGGLIIAGPQLSIDALAARSDKLPHVRLTEIEGAIGKTTEQALILGQLVAHSHAYEGIINDLQAALGNSARLIFTGGLGEMFSRRLTTKAEYIPNLALEGIRVAMQTD